MQPQPLDYADPALGGERNPTWRRVAFAIGSALFAAIALVSGIYAVAIMTSEWPLPQFYVPLWMVAGLFGTLAVLAVIECMRTKKKRKR